MKRNYRIDKKKGGLLIVIIIVLASILFRNSLTTIFGSNIGNFALSSLLICFPMFIALLAVAKFRPPETIFILYVANLILALALFPFLNEVNSNVPAFIGFVNLGCPFIFWFSVFKLSSDPDDIFSAAVKLVVFFGVVNAVGAILQFFLSVDLFGLVSNNIYSNPSVLENASVNRRAISFISSPQSLSLFLAFSLCISFFIKMGYIVGGGIRLVLLGAGILTFSKVFFVFLVVFFVFRYFTFKRTLVIASAVLGIIAILFLTRDYIGRLAQILYYLNHFEEYPAYEIWKVSLQYVWQLPDIIFGKGLGVFSRGGQSLGGYELLYGSTESFFIQLVVETGMVGFSLFSVLLVTALNKLYFLNKILFSCLLAALVVGVFTPTLYGFSAGIIFYFLVAYGITVRSKAYCYSLGK